METKREDGYKLKSLKESVTSPLANMINFLNPVLSSKKPSKIIAQVGATIIELYYGYNKINWAKILTKMITKIQKGSIHSKDVL